MRRWSRLGILWLVTGCAALFPELETPMGPPPNPDSATPPPPEDYVFLSIKSARMPSHTRDGRKWGKEGDGLPSAYAILFIDGKEITRTEVEQNTLEPTWPKQKKANFEMPSKRRLRVEVWDDHGLIPHPICLKELHNLPSYVDMGEVEIDCEGGGNITLGVEAAHPRWGLGFYYVLRSSSAYVTRVIAASPAGRLGLKPDDQILSIMRSPVEKMGAPEIQTLIRANSPTGVKLKISSGGGETRDVVIKDAAVYPLFEDHVPLE